MKKVHVFYEEHPEQAIADFQATLEDQVKHGWLTREPEPTSLCSLEDLKEPFRSLAEAELNRQGNNGYHAHFGQILRQKAL